MILLIYVFRHKSKMAYLSSFNEFENKIGASEGGFTVKKGDEWCFVSVKDLVVGTDIKNHTLKRGEWTSFEFYDHGWGIWGYHDETDSDTYMKLRYKLKEDCADGLFMRKDGILYLKEHFRETIEEDKKDYPEDDVDDYETLFEGRSFPITFPRTSMYHMSLVAEEEKQTGNYILP